LLRIHDRTTAAPRADQGDGKKRCGDHPAMMFARVGSVKHLGHDGATCNPAPVSPGDPDLSAQLLIVNTDGKGALSRSRSMLVR
jgi:hypothetical protein